MSGKNALIFGASGISGWSLMNQCLSYPSPLSFKRITGLCNRPLSKKETFLPDDPRLHIVPGIDLTNPVKLVAEQLKQKVEDIKSVNIVFFCAYIQTNDFESLRKVNTDILRTAIEATSSVAPNLEAVILQTGGKGYGLEFPRDVKIQPPLHEALPRIPEPWRSKIFYYEQYDLLKELSQGQNWTFSEVRPDGIVGFAPGANAMNMGHGIAFYLTLFREVYGVGARVPFPGKLHGYHSTHSDTFQDILSRTEIFVALNREKCGNGSSFNSADGQMVRWAEVWPGICEYFGLVGCEPQEDQKQPSMQAFVQQHQDAWNRLVETHQLKKGSIEAQNWGHTNFMLVDFDFDRQYSLERVRSVGYTESIDTVEGYKTVFSRMARAKIIPAFD